MKNLQDLLKNAVLLVGFYALIAGQTACQRGKSTLAMDPSSQTQVEKFYPNTPAGQRVKEHMHASMGHGEDAEAKYQESLTKLRAEPGAADALMETYRKIPAENYLLRTMLVEGLKELRSPGALNHLNEIAREKIPADRNPENTEIDTRADEVVIRITAVEGISILAANQSAEAERMLIDLTGNEDLTVRQMAARGYINSGIGNAEEKMQLLRRKLPESEHWYITTKATDPKQIQHPEMPKDFKLETKTPTDAPQLKKP
jgi:hypothetical protein